MKTKIYYVMDTMCGWCYGFSDVISQIHAAHKDKFDFTVVPSGMWVGGHVQKMNSALAAFMKTHNVTIAQLSGKTFGSAFEKNILEKENFVLDSLPGAKAMLVMQTLQKESLFEYMKKIYHAFYVLGQDANDWQVYAELALSFGIAKDVFEKEYFSAAQGKSVQESFAFAQQLGVSTYPSVVAVVDGKAHLLSQGYKTFDEVNAAIRNYR
ncbi:DsbA family protein [Azotosporobacter soli]|uniref:DsbA family protein n=1 Tax=Azotosporobacter soli TaxID=3055040 RepID=UPI0031FE4584